MSDPIKKVRRDKRIFISAVTKELGTVRHLVESGLKANDYHAVMQDDFALSYLDLKEKLRERIAGCDALIHIAGACYGAEPKERPDNAHRRSYTQMEYDLAKELGKPVYVFLAGAYFPSDPHEPESDELRELQQLHRHRLTSTGQDYKRAQTREYLDREVRSLQLKVEHLEEELTRVDHQVTRAGSRLTLILCIVVVLVAAALGATFVVQQQQRAQQAQARLEAARQEDERLKQQQEREKQDTERQRAEQARKQVEDAKQVHREYAEQFLDEILRDKQASVAVLRQRAIDELPSKVKGVSKEEIVELIDKALPESTPEAPVSRLDRACQALAQGELNDVLVAADKEP